MVTTTPGTDFVNRRVVVVEGALAFRMRRVQAARDGDFGLEVVTIPQLAARLAGGFSSPADEEVLYPAISWALAEEGLTDLAPVARLPGMVRAVTQTLRRIWRADFNLDAAADRSPRFHDLALIQTRVRATLPTGALIPTDLRDAAIGRVAHAKALLGSVHLEGLSDIDLVWRPLFDRLSQEVNVSWRAVGSADRAWFGGTVEATPETSPKTLTGEVAADPRAEVVEALRWARALLGRGDVLASDIALTAAAPSAWDDHFLVLAAEAGLPVHFSHGVPALSTRDGQACAALADVLIKGLSQDRVRRLINRLPSDVRGTIPGDWSTGLPRRAGLFTVEHWLRVLAATKDKRASGDAAEKALIPVLSLLANGVQAAEAAGVLLRGPALGLWRSALRAAPAAAVALSLETLRVRDERDPGNSIVWAPAAHLAAAPRRHLRLLGLSGRAWPRAESEDALLPNHLLPRRQLQPVSDTERDRLCFAILLRHSDGEVVLSRSRRSSEGSLLAQSSLWPRELKPLVRNRTRTPEHAFSESDRLLGGQRRRGSRRLSHQAEPAGAIVRGENSPRTMVRSGLNIRPLNARWRASIPPHRSSDCCATLSDSSGNLGSAGAPSNWRNNLWRLARSLSVSLCMNLCAVRSTASSRSPDMRAHLATKSNTPWKWRSSMSPKPGRSREGATPTSLATHAGRSCSPLSAGPGR